MSEKQDPPASSGRMIFGHPVVLFVLVFVGACEYFTFFGVRGLLVPTYSGDFGLEYIKALELFGTYSMATVAACVPGGFVADRLTGAKRGVLIGGFVAFGGCLLLAVPDDRTLYPGLVLLVLGGGLMRPSLWTLVGRIYPSGNGRHEVAFSVLFVGVNLGSALSGFAVGIGEEYGSHYGFGTAALALLLGQGVYAWKSRTLDDVSPKTSAGRPLTRAEVQRLLVVGIVAALLVLSSTAFQFAMGPFYAIAIAIDVQPVWLTSLHSTFSLLLAIPIAYCWLVWKRRGHESSSLLKIALGIMVSSWAFLFALPFLPSELGEAPWLGWLTIPQLLYGVGSLFMFPVAWSFVTKLAPLKYASTTIGALLAVSGLGSGLLHNVASRLFGYSLYEGGQTAVIAVVLFGTLLGVALIASLKPLKRLTCGADEGEEVSTGEAELADDAELTHGEGVMSGGARLLIFVLFIVVVNAVLAALDAPFWIY